MKKVLILQLLGKSFGGVWQVNKSIGEKLVSLGYEVKVVFLRDNKNDLVIDCDPKLILHTINKIDNWGDIPRKKDILTGKVSLFKYMCEQKKLVNDYKILKEYIGNYNPNYIISSHYQLLNGIPSDYLDRTIHVEHCAFLTSYNHKATRNTLYKYNGKIRIVWLSKKSCDNAIDVGYKNCSYIYNSVRFKSNSRANVIKNKKLVTIARFSEEKRLDLMIRIVKEVFSDDRLRNWVFEIYGAGPTEDAMRKEIGECERIKIMGRTDNPKDILLSSSINLNTSLFEGFSLSVLEANECGIPTIAFNFGESAPELILDNKTGIIALDEVDYKEKLVSLMLDDKRLDSMSKASKDFNKKFDIDNIIDEWLNLFKVIDDGR